MSAELEILVWWLLFGGTHIAGSSAVVRRRLIDAIGTRGFKGVYSLVAFATFIPLCVVYSGAVHAGRVLFDSPPVLWWTAQGLMLLSLVTLCQGQAAPSPMTTRAEMSGEYPDAARGIQRVTRHPQNIAFVLFGLAHLLVNTTAGDWIFFGGFVVYGLLSAVHQDARTRHAGPDAVRRFQDRTSVLPFAAILAGRQELRLGEWSKGALVVAIILFAVLRILHGRIFGGFGG